MTRFIRSIAIMAFSLITLAGCGSSPQVDYYSFRHADPGKPDDAGSGILLGLGPMRLPQYLNRSQIVTRGSGAALNVDEFSRWAEPLDEAMHRVLSANVDKMTNGVTVIAFPYESFVRTDVTYRMIGDVLRFDADSAGRVVLEVQWAVYEVGVGMAVPATRDQFTAQAAAADDPGAIVSAMNDALWKFSAEISRRFSQHLEN